METNVKTILGQYLLDHISYITLPPKIVLLDISNYSVNILVSMRQYYLRAILAYIAFDYPGYRLFNRYLLLWYIVIRHQLSGRSRSTKEVNNLIHLVFQLLVIMVSILNQRIQHNSYLMCKHVNHFVITLIHLLPHELERTTG